MTIVGIPFSVGLVDLIHVSASYLVYLPLFLAGIWIIRIRYGPLASIPGPFWASITPFWNVYHSGTDLHRALIEQHKKYGNVVKTGPNEVSIANLSAVKTIYGAGNRYPKSDWYAVFRGKQKFDLFAMQDEKLHAQQRRLVAQMYSVEGLKDLEPYVDKTIDVFLAKMDEKAGTVIELSDWLQLFAFDVIGEVTFSRQFGYMQTESDHGTFTEITKIIRSAMWLGFVPWVWRVHQTIMPLVGNWLDVNNRSSAFRQFVFETVKDHQNRGSDHTDMLEKLMALQKQKPEQMDFSDVLSVASANVGAGSDTYKAKLVQELEEAQAAGSITFPIALSQTHALKYLQACIYEGMRCHPAVGMTLPRVVPPGGLDVEGHHIPAGTIVGISAWVLHQNEEVFGEDADIFRPDRWLQENNGDMKRFFFSFGAGSRGCIGRNIAWMEMSKLIPTIFLKYNVNFARPNLQLTEECNLIVQMKGLDVVFEPRKQLL